MFFYSCVASDHFWLRPDMTSSGFCLLNTVAVAAVCKCTCTCTVSTCYSTPCMNLLHIITQAYARYNYSCESTSDISRHTTINTINDSEGGEEGKNTVRASHTYRRGHSSTSRPLKIAIVDIDIHHGNTGVCWCAIAIISFMSIYLSICICICMYVMHFVYRRLVGIISGNGTQEIIENLR
jgi:hypothetical protein